MASPQKENGYTPIANELLEQIYLGSFNGTQYKILMLIMRYTYGFSRKSHDLSLSFIHDALGGNKRNLQRELQNLINGRVIHIFAEAGFNNPRELGINKHHTEWDSRFRQQAAIETTDGEKDTTTDGELAATTDGEKDTTTDGEKDTTTDGEKDTTTDGELAAQDKQYLKQTIKQINSDFQSPCEQVDSKIPKKDLDEFFESLWALYPTVKRQGKGSVSETKKRALYNIGYEELSRCIDRYKLYIDDNKIETRYMKQGSTFFNTGYLDYLDKEYLKYNKEQASRYDQISDDPNDWRDFDG